MEARLRRFDGEYDLATRLVRSSPTVAWKTMPSGYIVFSDSQAIIQNSRLRLDIMRTHPMIIIGGILQHSPFFVPPEAFLREHQERRPGQTTSPSTAA